MKLNVWHLKIITITIFTFIAIILMQENLIFSLSSDTTVYYQFNQYLCTGKGFTDGNYWNKPTEVYYELLSFFYCADTYKNFIINSYYYFFLFFFIFIIILLKKFSFIETLIFIIIFFLAINPNHLISQGRQMGSLFLFFSAFLLAKNNRKTSYLLFIISFLLHNNVFIFLIGIYMLANLKNLINFTFNILLKNKKFLITLITILIILIFKTSYISYIFKNGIYIFNLIGPTSGHFGFSFSLISSFSKYLFFVQLFTLSFILFLNVKSELITYMAIYTYLIFFMILASMIFHLNFDMMIFRLLYVVKYIFVPLCFVYSYRKIIGKKCLI